MTRDARMVDGEAVPTLWHCADSRSFRVLWMLEELGVPYRLCQLPFPPRALSPGYLAENPLGTVPLYVEGEVRMTESVAILQYLATRHGRFMPDASDPGFADCLDGLVFGEATLTWPLALILRYGRFEAEARRQPQVVDDYAQWFRARLGKLEARLSDARAYYAGDAFGVADMSIGYALLLAHRVGHGDGWSDAIGAYWQRLAGRAGYARARQAQRDAEAGS